jgi:hypothetical protein
MKQTDKEDEGDVRGVFAPDSISAVSPQQASRMSQAQVGMDGFLTEHSCMHSHVQFSGKSHGFPVFKELVWRRGDAQSVFQQAAGHRSAGVRGMSRGCAPKRTTQALHVTVLRWPTCV